MQRRSRLWKGAMVPLFVVLVMALLLSTVLVGCAKEEPRQGEGKLSRPLKIGLLADQTGALAAYGYAHTKVAKGAVDKINKEGGVAGQPIELVIADTESNPSVATMKMRRLIEQEKVDFVIGSNTSGVVLAVAPIAKELRTVYFPTAGGALLTEPGKGNRWVFDFNTNVKQETLGAAKYFVQELGLKKWVTVVVDYAWGWDQEQSFVEAVTASGGQVLNKVRVPLGTDNWLRYMVGAVPKEAQAVYFANFGTDFLAFLEAIHSLRPDIVKVGGNYVLSGQEIPKLGAAAEGLYVIAGYPQYASEMNTPYDKEYRQTIGMDDYGKEVGTGKHLVASYQWSTWESIYAIKEVVEEIGWTGSQDTPRFIEALEGKQFKEGVAHPEGDKHFRPEDHLSIKGAWIEQVKNGGLVVVKRMPAEDLIYPAKINYPQAEPLK